MWLRALAIGSAAATFGAAALFPGTAARAGRELMTFGLAANRAVQREMFRAAAEAIEVVEDLVAEVRAETPGNAPNETPLPEVLAGRVTAGASTVQPMAMDASIAHAVGRRLRLRLRGAAEEGDLVRFAAALSGFPGVRRARIHPATRSVVLEGDGPASALAEVLQSSGMLRLTPQLFQHPAAWATSLALMRLDAVLRARSRGRHDLRSAVRMVLKAAETLRARHMR